MRMRINLVSVAIVLSVADVSFSQTPRTPTYSLDVAGFLTTTTEVQPLVSSSTVRDRALRPVVGLPSKPP